MNYEVGADESVSTAVVCAVSDADPAGRAPRSLPPLTNALDPAALDALFAAKPDGSSRRGGHIAFVYDDYRVTVENGEFITVRPIEKSVGGIIRRGHGW